uniref:Uncharacterized protein n=1 Tax=Acrobeloides nanus TaxID=290746 RepID=A0A914DMR0_9BILA
MFLSNHQIQTLQHCNKSTILALDQSTDSELVDRSRVKIVVSGSVDRFGVSRISGLVITYTFIRSSNTS